ncbi:MAG: tetratricopeptide repeat protein, partial [Myxococcota bacterium]
AAAATRAGVAYAASTVERITPRLDAWADAWHGARTEVCTRVLDERSPSDLQRASRHCLDVARVHVEVWLDLVTAADRDALQSATAFVANLRPPGDCREPTEQERRRWTDATESTAVADFDRRVARADSLRQSAHFAEAEALAHELVAEALDAGDDERSVDAFMVRARTRAQSSNSRGAAKDYRLAYFAAGRLGMSEAAARSAAALVRLNGSHLARPEVAREWIEHAEMMNARLVADPLREASLFESRAWLELSAGKPAAAETFARRALELREANLDSRHPDLVTAINALGTTLMPLGRFEEAAALRARSLALVQDSVGVEHPGYAGALLFSANVARARGDHARAERETEQALAIFETATGAGSVATARARVGLATLRAQAGRLDDAEALLTRAITSFEAALGDDHPDLAVALDQLGVLHLQRGDVDAAQRAHERAAQLMEDRFGPDHPRLARVLNNLANVHGTRGALPEAEALLSRALAIFERADGPDAPSVAYPLSGLARAALDRGRFAEAVAYLERALAVMVKADVDAAAIAQTHFELAQALEGTGAYPERARAEARAAITMVAADPRGKPLADAATRWLEALDSPPSQ